MVERSSRDRLMAAIEGQNAGTVPCSFMIFHALREKCRDELEFAERQAEMGLDVRVQIEDLAIRFSPEVEVKEWTEADRANSEIRLHRAYVTPAGTLTAVVRKTRDWPFGDHIPLFDDYVTPRSIKYLVEKEEDLPALEYLLATPTDRDIEEFREAAKARKKFADSHGFLLQAGWKSGRYIPSEDSNTIGTDPGIQGIDALMWLCGGTQPLIWGFEKPGFLEELIGTIAEWNRRRLAIHLETGCDLVVRRAWYEGADFWSPAFYRRFILPGLKREIDMAHQAGVKFGYILTSGMMPVADDLVESGIDVIIGLDPVQGKGTVLPDVARELGGKVGLWGGVSGPLTVELGTEDEVREAVESVLNTLGNSGRFILSPVDNVREDTARTWENIKIFIETWKSWSGRA